MTNVHRPCVDGNVEVACCNVKDNNFDLSPFVTCMFASLCLVNDTFVSFFIATEISVNSVPEGDVTTVFGSSTVHKITAYLSALSKEKGTHYYGRTLSERPCYILPMFL